MLGIPFFGILNAPWWVCVIVALVLAHITMVSVTVYLHRHQAHRALDLHPIAAHFFRFWLWLTTGMKTVEWVSVHRKHHAKCEQPEDPHSPQQVGIQTVLWQGAELYRTEKKKSETIKKYGFGTPNDWVEKHIYSAKFMRGKLGVAALLIIELVLFGVPGLIMWSVMMAWTPFFAAGVINGLGHWFGYRNYECEDASTNIFPWGILIAGEELHNNHHAYATSAKLSMRWWEFDIGWMYIKLMSFVGLAKVRRLPPKSVVSDDRNIDMDTLKAVVHNRMQVLAEYQKEVLVPVYNSERSKLGHHVKALNHKVKHLLIRNRSLINESDEAVLSQAFEVSPMLKKVYAFRDDLLSMWGRTSMNQKDLVVSLQAWCQSAEESGIDALARFVNYIRSYAIVLH